MLSSLVITDNLATCTHPLSWCGLNLALQGSHSTTTALSFSKNPRKAARYPATNKGAYVYMCYLPAPYVNLGDLYRCDIPHIYCGPDSGMDKNTRFPLRTPTETDGYGRDDDEEVFPLGVPELLPQHVLGCWKTKIDADAVRRFEIKFNQNPNLSDEVALCLSQLGNLNFPYKLPDSTRLTRLMDKTSVITAQPR